jgi:hypothetical protein
MSQIIACKTESGIIFAARKAKSPLDLLAEIRPRLERLAAAGDDLAGPFAIGLITRNGFEKVPA